MVFSSLTFLFVFFPIVLFLYNIADKNFKNIILLISSLIFYAWGEPIYVLLMLFSTIVDFFHGLQVEKFIKANNKQKAFRVVISSVVINLFILCFFKYSDFLILNINIIFNTNIPLFNLPLPIGISFYTFQTMSYTIDIYKGEANAQKNILDFGTYVALFPQLVAGPIVRYETVSTQINDRSHSIDKFSDGISRFILGLSKKVIIANPLGLVADTIFNNPIDNISILTAWLGIIAYTLQIFFDFSGYSDMAIGLGKVFGFDFLENFNYPYISQSATEFWRRWHISLGQWFRDYVYIPLGGNRVSKLKQYRNLFVVWILTGIWHGANWTFIFWGLYYGVLLALEKSFLKNILQKIPRIFRHIYLIIVVMIGWVFFRADNISFAFSYLHKLFNFNNNLCDSNSIILLKDNIIVFILAIILSIPIKDYINNKTIKIQDTYIYHLFKGLFLSALLLIITIILVNSTYNPFLYFRF